MYLDSGNTVKAIETLQMLVQQLPSDGRLARRLSLLYIQTFQFEKETLKKVAHLAVAAQPKMYDGYVLMVAGLCISRCPLLAEG